MGMTLCLTACNQPTSKEFTHVATMGEFNDHVMLQGTVQAVNTTHIMAMDELYWSGAVIDFLVEDGTMVEVGDTLCRLSCYALDESKEQLADYIQQAQLDYESGLANLKSQYAALEAESRNNQVQATLAALDSLHLDYYSPKQRQIAELNLKKAQIQQAKIDRKLALQKVINETNIAKLNMRLQQHMKVKERYDSYAEGLVIVAPTSGMFLRAKNPSSSVDDFYQEGDELQSMLLGEIPDMSRMKVSVYASEQQYKRLSSGQDVLFTFNGMAGNKAWGKVLSVASVGRPMNSRSTVTVFEVTCSIDSSLMLPSIGLSANALVTLNHQSEVLSIPIVALFDSDSTKVVYVQQQDHYIEQEVQVGKQSSHHVVIERGISQGDCLSLIRPKENNITEKRRLDNYEN